MPSQLDSRQISRPIADFFTDQFTSCPVLKYQTNCFPSRLVRRKYSIFPSHRVNQMTPYLRELFPSRGKRRALFPILPLKQTIKCFRLRRAKRFHSEPRVPLMYCSPLPERGITDGTYILSAVYPYGLCLPSVICWCSFISRII